MVFDWGGGVFRWKHFVQTKGVKEGLSLMRMVFHEEIREKGFHSAVCICIITGFVPTGSLTGVSSLGCTCQRLPSAWPCPTLRWRFSRCQPRGIWASACATLTTPTTRWWDGSKALWATMATTDSRILFSFWCSS